METNIRDLAAPTCSRFLASQLRSPLIRLPMPRIFCHRTLQKVAPTSPELTALVIIRRDLDIQLASVNALPLGPHRHVTYPGPHLQRPHRSDLGVRPVDSR